jgi:hypothetical protein
MLLSSFDRLRVMLVTLLLWFAVTGELKAVANLTLAQAQTAQNPKDEADRLLTEGRQKLKQNQFPAALNLVHFENWSFPRKYITVDKWV